MHENQTGTGASPCAATDVSSPSIGTSGLLPREQGLLQDGQGAEHRPKTPSVDGLIPQLRRRIAIFSGAELLGDGLFKLPFIRSLRATFPEAEIIWITSGATVYTGILGELVAPYLGRVVDKTSIGRSIAEILTPARIGLGPMDIVIDTQTVAWRSLAVRRALKPRRFIAATAGYFFSTTQPKNVDATWTKQKPVHFVDHLMRLIDLASEGDTVADDTETIIPTAFTELALRLLPEGSRYIGFAPGAGDITKRWPLDRFLRLAHEAEMRGYKPVFFVGPDEREMITPIRDIIPDALFPEDDVSNESLKGPLLVAALGRRLDAAIANDSGLGHMLAISAIPLILLYGRHSPKKYSPRTPYLTTLWAQEFGGPEHDRIPEEAVAQALWEAAGNHPTSIDTAFSSGTKR